jgi:hypothetical protein
MTLYNAKPPYTRTPLTKSHKVLKPDLPSGVLPSGEANFFDVAQHHEHNDGSGINAIFPSPESFIVSGPGQSGAYVTNPENPDLEVVDKSGIFSYNNLTGVFSNGVQSRSASIIDFSFGGISAGSVTDFTGFNNYVHYYGEPTPPGAVVPGIIPIRIPYISDVTIAVEYDPYSVDNIGNLI